MIEMRVTGLTIDPLTDMPIIILKDPSGKHAVPIWIGLVEASAIASELENVELARPQTHDLLRDVIAKMGGRVLQVEVNDLRENTFYARVLLEAGDRVVELDSRPSDAIALALRVGARILVAQRVVDRVQRIDFIDLEREPGARAKRTSGRQPRAHVERDELVWPATSRRGHREGKEPAEPKAKAKAGEGRPRRHGGARVEAVEESHDASRTARGGDGEPPPEGGPEANQRSAPAARDQEQEPGRRPRAEASASGQRAGRGSRAATGGRGLAMSQWPLRGERAPDGALPLDEGEVYRALLESLSDEDFGKWKM